MNKEIWQNPKTEKSLNEAQTPLWFWNDQLETGELLRQLDMKTEIGVACTIPHARTVGGHGYQGGYLDEQWYADIGTVVDYKKSHGERMWLYDEIDWPAGTCNRTVTRDEKNREQYITIWRMDIPAGEVFRALLRTFEGGNLFGIGPETDKSNMAFNINIVNAETEAVYDLEEFLIYDMFGPELEFRADRDSTAFITKIHVDPYEYHGDQQANYLDVDTTRQFLASTYDKYYERFGEEFGRTITGIFNDETRMANPIAWSRRFADAFLALKGYDIRREIFRLILPGERAGRVRCDYFDVLAHQYQENYFGELHRWCEAHQVRLFAHLLGEETLFGHARYSGDYLRQNRYMDICGADHLGKGIGSLNIKFTSSAAHSYGKRHTAVEVFAGCGWDMTFEEYSRIVTWMFQQGMHTIINHGFFYSDRGKRRDDWPPSQFFQWQGWNRQSEGNDMIRRLQYALTDGTNEADVLVYFPMESFWLHYLPDQQFTHGFFHGAFLKDEKAVRIDRETQLILNGLLSENLDFELIHRDAVENFCIHDGKIANKLNQQQFSVLVLPMCEVLPLEMAVLCEEFVCSGGRIIAVDELPHLAMRGEEDSRVCGIMERLRQSGQVSVFAAEEKERIYHTVSEAVPHPIEITMGTKRTVNNHPAYDSCLIDPYMHTGEDLDGVLFNRYLKDGKRNTLFMNYGSHPDMIEVLVETKGMVPEVWDTFTGEIRKAEVVRKEETGYVIRLELPCNYGLLVVSEL